MLAFGIAGVLAFRPEIQAPAFVGFKAPNFSGVETSLFPFVFVTIACGACSGFHSLVASGTTAKQLDNERHALPVGYAAMLLEGILGILAMCCLCVALSYLFSWLTFRAKSCLPAVFAHGALNGCSAAPLMFMAGTANPFVGPAPTGNSRARS